MCQWHANQRVNCSITRSSDSINQLYKSLRAYVLGDEFPGHLELPDGAVVQGRHDLHEGAEVVELDTLCGQLDKELEDLGPVHEVPLVGHTPHEEMGHLQVGVEREPLDFIFRIR